MLIKVITTFFNIQLKNRHYIAKVATDGQKMHTIIPTLRWMEVDKFLVDFSFNDLKVDIHGGYGDDTFILWLGCIDNLLNLKQALDKQIKSIYPNINFTMIYYYKETQFLDLLYM